ncbi:NADH-quinone oxidoreductase subunit A [Wolbachia endosymbiont of Corcyra cephalonica]|uniref:NADH-quinone oxidoreductase subunit A n=1 Tax=Wolbachia endosymbiont of Corcyra cephalonica TaxID=218111 RepID=UPI0034E1F84A
MNKNFSQTIEKNSRFECGFNPLTSPRNPFSIHFFKILLIFILFDAEIILILPLPLFQYYSSQTAIIYLLIILTIIAGLIFE